MKIAPRETKAFLGNPGQYAAILIYGPDEGQARDHARTLAKAVLGADYDPMNLVEMSGGQLKDDPARLADELNALSLLGGERLVVLRDPGNGLAPLIREMVVDGNPAAKLIVTAGELTPASKLRQLFEKEKTLAALACYRDEGRQLTQLIQEKFRERGITAEAEVIPYLAQQLGNDRGVTLAEIEKIDLFLGEERRLTLAQAILLSGDNAELTLDDLCHAVAGGQPAKLPGLLRRLYADGTQPIGIFRILHNHFQKLQTLQSMVAGGLSVDEAMKQLRIFFKQQPLLRAQLPRWSAAKILRAMDALLEGEKQVKRAGSANPEIICDSLLQRLSLSAARG